MSFKTHETDTDVTFHIKYRLIYSHCRCPLAPHDLVVVLFRVRIVCGELRCQRLPRRRHTAVQRHELPRPVFCALSFALALHVRCPRGARTSRRPRPLVLALAQRQPRAAPRIKGRSTESHGLRAAGRNQPKASVGAVEGRMRTSTICSMLPAGAKVSSRGQSSWSWPSMVPD